MIKVIQGDITTLAVDAIVNAANQVMLVGPSDFDPVIKYCADKRHMAFHRAKNVGTDVARGNMSTNHKYEKDKNEQDQN